jgi:hypothetical protein
MITIFPPALQWPPECSGPPINKPHTLTNGHTPPTTKTSHAKAANLRVIFEWHIAIKRRRLTNKFATRASFWPEIIY